jgi:AbrB family looped-hinge helix DNA binding protein
MTITVDEHGAIVLPEEVRRRLGVVAGSQLEVEADERGVLLRLVERKPLWQTVAESAEELPADLADQLPTDGAEQHDHYIYGTPRRPQP